MRTHTGSRPYKAGKQIAEALCETANILYLMDNREQYLSGIRDTIEAELEKVITRRKEMPE